MAKKRFTDGLSGLFENPFDAPVPTDADGTDVGNDEVSFDVDVPVKSPAKRKKLSGKGFTGSLDNFLTEQESPNRMPSRRRRTGLDFLIRSTVDANDEDRNPVAPKTKDTKRVTLVFRKDHLADLKGLAKERGMYLKDLVADMATKYLEE